MRNGIPEPHMSLPVLKPYEVRYPQQGFVEIGQPMARILLTEPDRAIREFIAGILTEFGHDVVPTENVVDAEVWLATSHIDVLVTDLVLRGEQGVTLSRSCRALGIPTVTLTGRDFLPDQLSRPPSLLEKPFRFSDLQRVLHAIDTVQSAAGVRPPTSSAA
jgi:two-component system, cell cycle response regulator CpdR